MPSRVPFSISVICLAMKPSLYYSVVLTTAR